MIMKKRGKGIALLVFVMVLCMIAASTSVYAAKKSESRAIAIVFDNSGSMYLDNNQAWCRATYAMEVFASMLNKGDTLLIYPMWPITIEGKEYTMERPFKLTDASDAQKIRNIYTPGAKGTPIESIDAAIGGIKGVKANKKYVVVLTDGDAFYLGGAQMNNASSIKELQKRFNANAGKDLTVMYLGIGSDVIMPGLPQSEYYVEKQAAQSQDTLSSLTDMCNRIFGRDTLPKNHFSGSTIDLDMSISKLIVFVQGENVSNLKVVGANGLAGKQLSKASAKYGTAGSDRGSTPDTTLQGTMVSYSDVSAGKYNVEFSGNATSIEVYYEPDADLDFVFTDEKGRVIDPKESLYEGNYKVSYGMKDAKTGDLIESDLLGTPVYEGKYYINGKEVPISSTGFTGETPVELKMGDLFRAEQTVTYLSGYTIKKNTTDFGWPDPMHIDPRPAEDLILEITGGDKEYSLQDLKDGSPFVAKLYYKDKQLTGEELKKVTFKWDENKSNANVEAVFAQDHYKLTLGYKDANAPQKTNIGSCNVPMYAYYTAPGSEQSEGQAFLKYLIRDNKTEFKTEVYAAQDYIVIKELGESKEITVNVFLNGKPLPENEFKAVKLTVDCSGINNKVTENPAASSFSIKLLDTEGLDEGDYEIKAIAEYTDHIGRKTPADKSIRITLSNTPLWVKWAKTILWILLIIAFIIWLMHRRVLPTRVKLKDAKVIVDGEDVTVNSTIVADIRKGSAYVRCSYGGANGFGVSTDAKAGKESYLKNPRTRRYAEVSSASVRAIGDANINEVTIGTAAKYVLNQDTGRLERTPSGVEKPFDLKNNMPIRYSGTLNSGGSQVPFNVSAKLSFKKK